MTKIIYTGDELWERIERAVDKVKDRLNRVVSALGGANVPFSERLKELIESPDR